MLKLITLFTKQYYLWGSLLILFFFFRGGESLLNSLSPNWGYVFDQLGLAVLGGALGLAWLRKKERFRLGWVISLLIIFIVLISHYHSFYRTFFFDELRNIINHLGVLHGYQGDPSNVAFGFAGPSGIRERYSWSISTIVYELVGINRSYSLFSWAASNILLLVIASLSTAWLTGVLSKSRLAALIAGILVGINPNSFMSLTWLTNIQTDALGVILVTFTVSVWIIARRTNDWKGIFIALILLAATLKGGSAVRTAMTGALLVLTDVIFFSGFVKKKMWLDWLKIFLICIAYYLPNPAVHWQPPSTPSGTTMDFPTRLAFLADATTRSFIPPLILISLLNKLKAMSNAVTWTVVVGTAIFILGTTASIITFFKTKYKIFAWGWLWFYVYIWFIPWLAELYSKPNDDAGIAFAGYKYAYLSLVGVYIAISILLSQQIRKIYRFTEQKKKLLGLIFALLTVSILTYRFYEFVKLDSNWRTDYSTRVSSWYSMVFGMFTPPTGIFKEQNKNPKVLVELDKDHIAMEATLFIPTIYYDGSLLFYDDVNTFYKESIIEKKTPPERVYAITWDVNKKEVINISPALRRWLIEGKNSKNDISNFRY